MPVHSRDFLIERKIQTVHPSGGFFRENVCGILLQLRWRDFSTDRLIWYYHLYKPLSYALKQQNFFLKAQEIHGSLTNVNINLSDKFSLFASLMKHRQEAESRVCQRRDVTEYTVWKVTYNIERPFNTYFMRHRQRLRELPAEFLLWCPSLCLERTHLRWMEFKILPLRFTASGNHFETNREGRNHIYGCEFSRPMFISFTKSEVSKTIHLSL